MNKIVLAGIAAGVLIAGLILSPVFMRQSHVAQAQAFGVCKKGSITKTITLHAQPTDTRSPPGLQVFPDNLIYPGGIRYHADVFGTTPTDGTIPGPLISLTQGENLRVTLVNDDPGEIHSLDFHMGHGTDQANSGPVPGTTPTPTSKTWTICNPAPGAWFYHCSGNMLNGIWTHIANGMYGGVVVHPLLEKPAKEFYMVFGQLFTDNTTPPVGLGKPTTKPLGEFDLNKFFNDQPDVIMTNGMGFKYVPSIGSGTPCTSLAEDCKLSLNTDPKTFGGVFKVKPGELTRWYIFNAGPNDGVAFHFIGTYQNDYYGFAPYPPPGHLLTQDLNDQVNWIPPADGQVIETIFPQAGLYVGVDHNMNHVIKGGAFAVIAAPSPTPWPWPPGTWVPPKGSTCVTSTCAP
jgi:nitrite reductase (NO-forming)